MTKLNINFINENMTEELNNQFYNTISFENKDIALVAMNKSLKSLMTKYENKDGKLSETALLALSEQIDNAKKEIEKVEQEKTALEPDYNTVIDAMTAKNENHFGNDKDVVRTVLRVLACTGNDKAMKSVIIPEFKDKALYEALENIHMCKETDENGMDTRENKALYKTSADRLETIFKDLFSLPFETPYTTKMRVKLTRKSTKNEDGTFEKSDIELLNDCYITGFKNEFTESKDGVVSFNGRQVNTLVRTKKNKKTGVVEYDYSGLGATIAKIVIRHYFA